MKEKSVKHESPELSSVSVVGGLVCVVVLNWNGWRDTVECLDSLKKLTYPHYRVVVVDNGSTDESVSKLQPYVPAITLLTTDKNLGFSGGNNVGIRWAIAQGAEFILLLNNDTVVAPDLLDAFVAVVRQQLDAGALAAKIYYSHEPNVLWFAGSKIVDRFDSPQHVGGGEKDEGQYDQFRDIPFVNGCAFFIRTKAISQVGLLDERYFLGFEDADWTIRFLQAGYRCLYVPPAKVWHKTHAATGGQTSQWWYYYERNRLLWLRTHFREFSLVTVLKASLTGVGREIVASISVRHPRQWLGSWWQNWPKWLARLLGIVDYLRGRYGECPRYVRLLSSLPCGDIGRLGT